MEFGGSTAKDPTLNWCKDVATNGTFTHKRTYPVYDIISANSRHVETCVLLARESYRDNKTVSLKVDMNGINFKPEKYIAPKKPTYDDIKEWVLDKYGFKVSSLYIAQTKEKAGIYERDSYNVGSGKGVVPNCPKEKEDAIMDAFRHFNMI